MGGTYCGSPRSTRRDERLPQVDEVEVYVAEDERGVLWSDSTLQIDWPVREPVL